MPELPDVKFFSPDLRIDTGLINEAAFSLGRPKPAAMQLSIVLRRMAKAARTVFKNIFSSLTSISGFSRGSISSTVESTAGEGMNILRDTSKQRFVSAK